MRTEGITQEIHLLQLWVWEDNENIYLFECSDCAFIWMIENKPELVESETARDFGECWSGHKSANPRRIIKKVKPDG